MHNFIVIIIVSKCNVHRGHDKIKYYKIFIAIYLFIELFTQLKMKVTRISARRVNSTELHAFV